MRHIQPTLATCACSALVLLALTACGGSNNDSDNDALNTGSQTVDRSVTLSEGVWEQQINLEIDSHLEGSQGSQRAVRAESIQESGPWVYNYSESDRVLVSDCIQTVTSLPRQETAQALSNTFLDDIKERYNVDHLSLQSISVKPVGEQGNHYRLIGSGAQLDLSIELQKIGEQLSYDRGTVSVAGNMIQNVNLEEGVCASVSSVDAQVPTQSKTIEYTITLPYQDSLLMLSIEANDIDLEATTYQLSEVVDQITVRLAQVENDGNDTSISTIAELGASQNDVLKIDSVSDSGIQGSVESDSFSSTFDVSFP